MNKKVFALIGIIFFTFTLQAQVAMGKWRTHFAYNLADQIAQSENKIFAVSEGSLFSIDKRDGNMEFYNKISGLNGTVISRIEYDEVNKILLIIYNDGNIDFLSASGVKNLPDFYNKQMSANKAINHILFHDNKAFLSSNFGIITLNMLKMEIQDTYYIGDNASEVKILNTTIHKGNIYAVSESVIYVASASNPLLISYESWGKMTNLPGNGIIQALYSFADFMILLREGKLYKQDENGTWSNLDSSLNLTGIAVSGDYLQGYSAEKVVVFDKQLTKSEITGLFQLKDGVYDVTASKFWFAGDPRGVILYDLNTTSIVGEPYLPEGPAINIPYKLKFAGERLFVLPGAKWPGLAYRLGYVMIFENNKWKNISPDAIKTVYPNLRVEDFSSIAVDPDDNTHYYVSGATSGIYEFKNDEIVQLYNYLNSNIEKVNNYRDDVYQWVDNCVLDKDMNLLITNDKTSAGIKIRKNDGNWIKLDYPGIRGKIHLGKILISNQNPNQKWALARKDAPGICIFDDNGTLDDQSDDQTVFLSAIPYRTSDGIKTIAPGAFNTIEQEKNGTIWIGTNEGPLRFSSTSNPFHPDFMAERVIISRQDETNLGDYLLENQNITTILIDGANRKWFGTENSGVYLMSENSQETIHHFTTQNSPLTSNYIMSLETNPTSGEVFIGTGTGLLSFQSDAAESNNIFKNTHVYPNPVRENFSGIITITGLVENTTVKITDVSGNLICETISNGSIATWDGKNKFGQKVSTGVYLAICVSPDGQQSTTQKILVIN